MKYILAIDQGTTSSRAFLYNENFEVVGMAQQSFPQHFPKADWVEHDLEEIWGSVETSIKQALASVKDPLFEKSKIACIGITNQRETFGIWERKSGAPLGMAIVWQCRRSAAICEKLKKTAAGKKLCALTGLVLDPYFSGTKLKWRLDNDKALKKRAQAGELAFGTMDTFLVWRLSAGRAHVTDVSNASRTLLLDLKTRCWSSTALKTLGVPAELLPEVRDSDAHFGETSGLGYLPDGIPIHGILGDQQSALFGQLCLQKGEAKITYGTGAFMLLNTGSAIRRSRDALSTVAWTRNGKTEYALEASVFIAGAAVSWLRDGLNLIHKSPEVEVLARSVPDSDGVFFIPALSGLGSPYWAPHARGLIGGLSRRSTKAHVARACLEGVAYSIADVFESLSRDAGTRLKKIRVDGGAAANEILLQNQADLLQTAVWRPSDLETTVRGAAYMAASGAGLGFSAEDLRKKERGLKEIRPKIGKSEAKKRISVWRRRVHALLEGAY